MTPQRLCVPPGRTERPSGGSLASKFGQNTGSLSLTVSTTRYLAPSISHPITTPKTSTYGRPRSPCILFRPSHQSYITAGPYIKECALGLSREFHLWEEGEDFELLEELTPFLKEKDLEKDLMADAGGLLIPTIVAPEE